MRVVVSENEHVDIIPGDEIVLPNGDRLVYLTGKSAQAHKLLKEVATENINRVIEHVRSQYVTDRTP